MPSLGRLFVLGVVSAVGRRCLCNQEALLDPSLKVADVRTFAKRDPDQISTARRS
jgi:hypothetical protein